MLNNLLGQLVNTLEQRGGQTKFRNFQDRFNADTPGDGLLLEEFEELSNPSRFDLFDYFFCCIHLMPGFSNKCSVVFSFNLSPEEEMKLEQLLLQVKNGQVPDLTTLNDAELDKFISYLGLLQMSLSGKVGSELPACQFIFIFIFLLMY